MASVHVLGVDGSLEPEGVGLEGSEGEDSGLDEVGSEG